MNIAMLLNPKCDIKYLINDDSVRQGFETFRVHGYSSVPVLNCDGTYYGIVSDKDFLSYIIENNIYSIKDLEDISINKIIKKGLNPPVNINASLDELIKRITDWNFVPIVDCRNTFVGIITRKTVINYLSNIIKNESKVELYE